MMSYVVHACYRKKTAKIGSVIPEITPNIQTDKYYVFKILV